MANQDTRIKLFSKIPGLPDTTNITDPQTRFFLDQMKSALTAVINAGVDTDAIAKALLADKGFSQSIKTLSEDSTKKIVNDALKISKSDTTELFQKEKTAELTLTGYNVIPVYPYQYVYNTGEIACYCEQKEYSPGLSTGRIFSSASTANNLNTNDAADYSTEKLMLSRGETMEYGISYRDGTNSGMTPMFAYVPTDDTMSLNYYNFDFVTETGITETACFKKFINAKGESGWAFCDTPRTLYTESGIEVGYWTESEIRDYEGTGGDDYDDRIPSSPYGGTIASIQTYIGKPYIKLTTKISNFKAYNFNGFFLNGFPVVRYSTTACYVYEPVYELKD